MTLSAYQIAIIGIGGTIVGVLTGVLLTYWFALKLANKNAKHIASIRLRDAFAPEIAKLNHPDGYSLADVPHFLEIAFEKHQIAINNFRFFLTNKDGAAFDKAWHAYYKDSCEDKPNFTQYMTLSNKDTEKAINRIMAILEFTKN